MTPSLPAAHRPDGQTLLHLAAANDFLPLATLLIDEGADVDAQVKVCGRGMEWNGTEWNVM